jgi:phospholipid-binding lipoprotein MlaA
MKRISRTNNVFRYLLLIFLFFAVGCAHQPDVFDVSRYLSLNEKNQPGLTASDSVPSYAENQEDAGFSEEDDFSDETGGNLSDDLDFWDETAEEDVIQVADPLAPVNRIMFHFNDKLYFWVLKPVAKGYKAVTPNFVRIGVRNFFHNLAAPIRMANCILQGKPHTAEVEFARFLINTTVGGLGFADVAKNNPKFAKPPEEDLGQTLATYGIGNGFYIVWPILGPSTLRDSAGILGDRFLNPITWADIPIEEAVGATVFKTVNETSFRIGDYESVKDAAIQPYEAFRDAYLQYRKKKAENKEEGESERRYDIFIKEWVK